MGKYEQSEQTDIPTAEIVAEFNYRPGNPSIGPNGDIFLTVHPLDAPSTKLVQLLNNGQTTAYPNQEFSTGKDSEFNGGIGIRTDDSGVAWLLDIPTHRLLGVNTISKKLVREIKIPSRVLAEKSFLQDFALDQKRQRIIIADMTQGDLKSSPEPAFVVVDLVTGNSKRVANNHPSMLPDFEGGLALNPITIDPNYEYIYFGAMHSKKLYRVPAASFDKDTTQITSTIEYYGPKPYSDGITVDNEGNVYITDIEKNVIGVTTNKEYRVLENLPTGQSWPDGMSFGPDGFVYTTINQLERSAALSGKDTGTGTYLLVRTKSLAPGHTGR